MQMKSWSIFQEQLKTELEQYYRSLDVLVECYSSGEELLMDYAKKHHDIVFLDIEMEGMNGLQVARQLHEKNRNLPIVLVTTHTELAMEGYEVQAFRFLSKPVKLDKLIAALQAMESLLLEDEKISIVNDGVNMFLPCKSICYIKSENVYLQVITTKESYLIRKKLKEQMKELPSNVFVQVHRSYVVNMRYIVSFDGVSVTLEDGTKIPVSKGKRETFKAGMMRYMREK